MGGALASVRYLKESQAEREAQKQNTFKLRNMLLDHRLPVMHSYSHIVPVLVGNARQCRQVTDALLKRNIYIQPINYPTVPVGTERLRITPGPQHSQKHMEILVNALVAIWKEHDLPLADDSH